ncbi:MAG: hypothetical protein LBF49_02265 [Puniceicoccales bacterium]|jgi:hypothetical protein|nr:hypothetical protein [Puniceicoccales bacterium]
MNKINVRNMPIEIISFNCGCAKIKIGDIPTMIIDPNPCVTKEGMVFLLSIDEEKEEWEELIELTKGNLTLPGFTDDPRLVKIAERVLGWRFMEELQPGTIIPPLSE